MLNYQRVYSGWWFGTWLLNDFPQYAGDNPSHWLSYFSWWLKPPTRIWYDIIFYILYISFLYCIYIYICFFHTLHIYIYVYLYVWFIDVVDIYIYCVYIVYIVTADFGGKSALNISGVLVVFKVYLWFIGMGMFIIESKHAYVFSYAWCVSFLALNPTIHLGKPFVWYCSSC